MTTNTQCFTRMQLSTSAYYGVQEVHVVILGCAKTLKDQR